MNNESIKLVQSALANNGNATPLNGRLTKRCTWSVTRAARRMRTKKTVKRMRPL